MLVSEACVGSPEEEEECQRVMVRMPQGALPCWCTLVSHHCNDKLQPRQDGKQQAAKTVATFITGRETDFPTLQVFRKAACKAEACTIINLCRLSRRNLSYGRLFTEIY